jgi:hypothetical protein
VGQSDIPLWVGQFCAAVLLSLVSLEFLEYVQLPGCAILGVPIGHSASFAYLAGSGRKHPQGALGDFLTWPAVLARLPIDPLDSANKIKVAVSA